MSNERRCEPNSFGQSKNVIRSSSSLSTIRSAQGTQQQNVTDDKPVPLVKPLFDVETINNTSTQNQEEPSFVLQLHEMSRNPQLESQKTASLENLKNLEVSQEKDIYNSNNSSLIAQVLPIIQQEEDDQEKKMNTMAEEIARKKSEYLGD